ncbi:MAG TPA: hypothetical protein VFI31_28705 [Pirellulales bacterium]|nr:hypothetical protein [Pirellulales bacterium]
MPQKMRPLICERAKAKQCRALPHGGKRVTKKLLTEKWRDAGSPIGLPPKKIFLSPIFPFLFGPSKIGAES